MWQIWHDYHKIFCAWLHKCAHRNDCSHPVHCSHLCKTCMQVVSVQIDLFFLSCVCVCVCAWRKCFVLCSFRTNVSLIADMFTVLFWNSLHVPFRVMTKELFPFTPGMRFVSAVQSLACSATWRQVSEGQRTPAHHSLRQKSTTPLVTCSFKINCPIKTFFLRSLLST